MRSGRLKRCITIESPPDPKVTDAAGEPVQTWTPYLVNVMSDIEPLFGRELIAAQQKYNTVSHKVCMRYVPGVNAKMRIKYVTDSGGTRYFNILSVFNTHEDGREMNLLCEEGLVNG